MSPVAGRRSALLHIAAAIGLAGPLAILLVGIPLDRPLYEWAMLTAIVGMVVAWIVWRRTSLRRAVRRERWAALVGALCGVGILTLGDGPLSFGGVWIVALMLAHTFGALATIGYTAALCAIAAIGHIMLGHSLTTVVDETVATAVLAGFGTAFALILRDADQVERARDQLFAEHETTLRHLELTNAELEHRLGSEQDLVLAQERERTARELHDGLGHRLTAMGMSLEYGLRTRHSDVERAWAEVERARNTSRDALDAMRRVVRAMNPIETGALRGVGAFEAIADAFRSTGIDVRVSIVGERTIPHQCTLLLLRFVQEGLTNVVRHSASDRVDLSIQVGSAAVEAELIDFESRSEPSLSTVLTTGSVREGFGLRALRSRTEGAGGAFTAHATDHGVRLWILIPVDAVAQPQTYSDVLTA